MDNKTKLILINYWIDNGTIEEIPGNLKDKLNEKDLAILLLEIETKQDSKQLQLSDIVRYRDKLEERIYREERALIDEKIVNIQKSTNYSQWIIVIVMVITVIISLFTAGLSYYSYLIKFEQSIPNLQLYIDCPPEDTNNILKISIVITNSGENGAYVDLNVSSPNAYFVNAMENGIPIILQNKSSAYFKPAFVERGDRHEYRNDVNTAEYKALNLEINFESFCHTKNCKFNTPNKGQCVYNKSGNKYTVTPQCIT